MVGWTAHIAFADTILPFEYADEWLRRRLRQMRWKKEAPTTRYRSRRAPGYPRLGRSRS